MTTIHGGFVLAASAAGSSAIVEAYNFSGSCTVVGVGGLMVVAGLEIEFLPLAVRYGLGVPAWVSGPPSRLAHDLSRGTNMRTDRMSHHFCATRKVHGPLPANVMLFRPRRR